MNNDRFKFRFWNNKAKKFFDDSYITLYDLQLNDGLGVIEQCTGLKDRNGELIYEGDRVKTVTGKVGTVKWRTGYSGFMVFFPGSNFNFPCSVDISQEVVGNIHEGKDDR